MNFQVRVNFANILPDYIRDASGSWEKILIYFFWSRKKTFLGQSISIIENLKKSNIYDVNMSIGIDYKNSNCKSFF